MSGLTAEKVVGVKVQVTTASGESIIGTIFTFDSNCNCVVIEEEIPNTTEKNIRILKASFLSEIKVVGVPEKGIGDKALEKLPYVEVAQIREREGRALEDAHKKSGHFNPNVTPEVQAVFDSLVKTMPCVWVDHDVIQVNKVVYVTPPYNADSCTGSDSTALTRVQKVLRGEAAGRGT